MDSTTTGLFIGALVLLLVASLAFSFNDLVNKRIETRNAWSQIDVQLNRRYDLIPNLIETVKGYAAHERETFEKVTEARNMAVQAQGIAQQAQAENLLTGALKSLFAVAEAYPELKANENFLHLQEELTSTENRIAFARQHFNDVVGEYNATRERVPTNMVATLFGFKPVEFFEIDEARSAEVRAAPTVRF